MPFQSKPEATARKKEKKDAGREKVSPQEDCLLQKKKNYPRKKKKGPTRSESA